MLAHHLTIGGLIAFNSLILLANAPLGTLLGLWDNWLQSKVLLGRVQDIFDYGDEQPGAPDSYRSVPTSRGPHHAARRVLSPSDFAVGEDSGRDLGRNPRG